MTFYVSYGDCAESDIRVVYGNNRRGFGARRIPRKQKKRLLRDWTIHASDAESRPVRGDA